MNEEFKKDVLEGLSKEAKSLSSKYFYDKKGDELFQKIMDMPEYYLTRAEMEIFSNNAKDIIGSFKMEKDGGFELIELGAGDGSKTIKLLEQLISEHYNFEYIPIDISQNALDGLSKKLAGIFPELTVNTMQGTYFNVLQQLKEKSKPKVVLFLGSNLGNLSDEEASQFIYDLGACMHRNDKILIGLDKIKSRDIVLPAYNDKQEITKEFNLNLLDRINRELGANFNRSNFDHAPEYDESEGVAKSFILSTENQSVTIDSLNKSFDFRAGEKIQTEISRKYSKEVLSKILEKTDFTIEEMYTDDQSLFMNFVLSKN